LFHQNLWQFLQLLPTSWQLHFVRYKQLLIRLELRLAWMPQILVMLWLSQFLPHNMTGMMTDSLPGTRWIIPQDHILTSKVVKNAG